MMRRLILACAFSLAFVGAAGAVEPGEMLSDPHLEARARSISEGLRCLVCQNESVDESHAELAKDIRLLVRRRLLAGDSNAQVRNFLVARYGPFILLRPPIETQTLLLWGTPLIVLVLGGVGLVFAARRTPRPSSETTRPLDAVEQSRLDEILADAGTSDAESADHASFEREPAEHAFAEGEPVLAGRTEAAREKPDARTLGSGARV